MLLRFGYVFILLRLIHFSLRGYSQITFTRASIKIVSMPDKQTPVPPSPMSSGPGTKGNDPAADGASLTLKQKLGDATNRWLAKNCLLLRQTPVWAQGMAVIVIGLGSIAFIGSVFLKLMRWLVSKANSVSWGKFGN